MSTADAIALGANIGTLLLILSGIAVGVLRRYQRFRDFVLLRPLRRAVGELPEVDAQSLTAQFMVSENETSTGLRGPPLIARLGRWPRIVSWLRAIEQERMIQRRLKAPVLEALGRRSIAPGHIVAEVCAGPGAATWDITAPVLAKIFHTIRQSPEPLLARILYPYEAQHLIQVVDRIDEYLHRFVKCKALDDVRQGSPVTQRESFGAFAIALTGAIVLADAAETKERHAKEALIWHSRDFRSGQSMSDAASRSQKVISLSSLRPLRPVMRRQKTELAVARMYVQRRRWKETMDSHGRRFEIMAASAWGGSLQDRASHCSTYKWLLSVLTRNCYSRIARRMCGMAVKYVALQLGGQSSPRAAAAAMLTNLEAQIQLGLSREKQKRRSAHISNHTRARQSAYSSAMSGVGQRSIETMVNWWRTFYTLHTSRKRRLVLKRQLGPHPMCSLAGLSSKVSLRVNSTHPPRLLAGARRTRRSWISMG